MTLITGAERKAGAQRWRTDGGGRCWVWLMLTTTGCAAKSDSTPRSTVFTWCFALTARAQNKRGGKKVSRRLSFIKCGTFSSPAQWVTVMTEWSEVKGWAHAWRRGDYRRSDVNEITGWGLHCAAAAPQTWKKLCFYTVRETAGEAELTFPEFVGN